jgi:putative ABC transport system permease protein
MFAYYLQLGVRSLRRNPILTALMVLTLAVGVAASVSTLTILHVMSGDPIPHKSKKLLVPVIDTARLSGYVPGALSDDHQMSYGDASRLLAGKEGLRRTAVYGLGGVIAQERPDLPPLEVRGLAVTNDYFTMFETPFLHGAGWGADAEASAANVIVLSRKQSEIMYGKTNPVGKRMRLLDNEFQIIGVRDDWKQIPRYTHLISGDGSSFEGEDLYYIPFSTAIRLKAGAVGNVNCHQGADPGYQGFLDSDCTWIQFWYEVAAEADVPALKSALDAYANEQKKLGRIERPNPVRLYNVMDWMDRLGIVRSDSKLATWLAFGFLLLCLVNTVGLLMAKYAARASEVGVRRALGASRSEIFKQFLIETAVIGLAGALLGLPLSFLAMRIIADSSAGLSQVPQMDWFMLGTTFLLSVGASIMAGLLPTWRACQVTPALQLKSQ